MKEIKNLIEEFSQRAINQYKFTLEGDYKRGNAEVKKINIIYDLIKKQDSLEELLQLIYSDISEVACLAAAYCMNYYSEQCLTVLEQLSKEDTLIGFEAEYAIKNWKNNQLLD